MREKKMQILGEIEVTEKLILSEEMEAWCGIVWDKIKNYEFKPSSETVGKWICATSATPFLFVNDGWFLAKIEHLVRVINQFQLKENVLLLGTSATGKEINMGEEKQFRTYSPCVILEKDSSHLKFKGLHKATEYEVLIVKKID